MLKFRICFCRTVGGLPEGSVHKNKVFFNEVTAFSVHFCRWEGGDDDKLLSDCQVMCEIEDVSD